MPYVLAGIKANPPQEVFDFLGERASEISHWQWVPSYSTSVDSFTTKWRLPPDFGAWMEYFPSITLNKIHNTAPPLFVGIVEGENIGFWSSKDQPNVSGNWGTVRWPFG